MKQALIMILCLALGACAVAPRSADTADTDLRTKLRQADRALREARLLDAEILYRGLAKNHPTLPDVWLRLGNIYVRQSQNAAAVRVYKKGLRYRRQDGRLWYNLAIVQLKQSVETLEAASLMLPPDSTYIPRIRMLHNALLSVSDVPADTDSHSGLSLDSGLGLGSREQ